MIRPPETETAVPVISPDQARSLMADGALLIDVREPAELDRTGRLEDAINLPSSTLGPDEAARWLADLPEGRALILYCAAGVRSARAGALFQALGHGRVYNLGGFAAAVAAGYPVSV